MFQRKTIAWALVTCSTMLVLLTAMLPTASGQSVTGRISGTVLDPQSAVIPGAAVTMTNAVTGQTREVKSGSQGEFVFTNLLAGTYEVSVTSPGFKVYQQKDIKLSTNETMALRNVQLEIGTTAETVEVTANAARVETQSSERTALISTTQVSELAISPDRDFISMLRVLPGVLTTAMQDPSRPPIGGQLNINGGKSGQAMVTLDGIADHSTESTWSGQGMVNPNIDAISEVKVMLSNYTAEYGIRSGGTINVSIKNGTKEFHGSAYEYKRHEKLNANNWINKTTTPVTARQRYRYDNFGYTIGGPITFLGFNKNREKLFFFASMEWLRHISPSGLLRLRFPTADERTGDFSQTILDQTGKKPTIKDPNTGLQFSDGGVLNKIPASYGSDPVGRAYLNFYPQPTQAVAWYAGSQYNYLSPGYNTEQPRNQQIFRIDWNVAPKTLIYGRFVRTSQPWKMPTGQEAISTSWPVLGSTWNPKAKGFVTTWIQTFSPSIVNELTAGFNKGITENTPYAEDLPKILRSNIPGLADFKQLNPALNPMNIMPAVSFSGAAGGPGAPAGGASSSALIPDIGISARFLAHGDNTLGNITDNFSWVKGKHSLKFGFYSELVSRNSIRESDRTGTLYFNTDTSNPLDSGLPMANAFIGSATKYTESDKEQWSHARYKNIEFYMQDSWRVSRRLTLDIGIRFQNIAPTTMKDASMAMFLQEKYDASKAMTYIKPYGLNGKQGLNPLTGEIFNTAVYNGSFAMPAGVTYTPVQMFPAAGIFDGHYLNNPGWNPSPRFGFAYDVFGDGKMAIRGGFGMFYERSGGDETQANYIMVPPLQNLMTIWYTTVSQIKTATKFTYGPGSTQYAVRAGQRDFSEPGSYNWSLGIQRDMGLGLVLDASYVGTVGRHMRRARSINALRYGTHFQTWAQNLDAPVPGGSFAVLPDNMLRPYQGYDTISYFGFNGNSNYHSMQMTLNRRFGTRLTISGNWVWSKVMDYGTPYEAAWPIGLPYYLPDSLLYSKADTDHTHNVMVNFTYKVPGLSNRLGSNIIAKGVFDGWVVSGIGSFVSGSPATASYTFSSPTDITGADTGESGAPTRVSIVGNAVRSNPTGIQSRLNPDAIVLPKYGKGVCQYNDPYTCGLGNAGRYIYTGSGTNNWDMTFYKGFQLGKSEERSLEFRCETYNTFNHTQYSSVSASARYNAAGQQTNTSFGNYTNTKAARKVVLAMRLKF
jgi:hypothetical protein